MSDVYEIIGKPKCPYCTEAKKVADENGLNYTYIDSSQNPEVLDRARATGHTTFPFVFKNGGFLGGCDTLKDDVLFSTF